MQSSNASLAVNHQGQFPVVTLSFNLAPGASLGDATKQIQQAEKDILLPPSIHAAFQGTAAAFQNSLASEPYLILAAVITVYIVLGVLYESYICLLYTSHLVSPMMAAAAAIAGHFTDIRDWKFQ